MPNALKAMAIKRVELGLQLSTGLLVTFAAGLALLPLSIRFGVLVDNFDALAF
jgi:hypothetical protein